MTGFNKTERLGVGGRLFLLLFFGAFLGMGGLFIWMGFLNPTLRYFDGQNWVATEARITETDLEIHSGDSTSWEAIVRYTYQYNAREYQGDAVSFFNLASSDKSKAVGIVRQYPAGNVTTAYVNPDDPTEAVLRRDWSAASLWGLFGLPFFLIGLGGWLVALGVIKTHKKRGFGGKSKRPFKAAKSAAPVGNAAILKPEQSRLGGLAVVTGIAIFWNGVVGVFLYQLTQDFQWFLALFMIPFVLVGIGLIAGVLYTLLSLANPKPELRLEKTNLALGDTVDLYWRLEGRVSRILTLRITLEGEEQATYRRGTDTRTDKSLFYRQELLNQSAPVPTNGHLEFVLPADSVPTFSASNNKIVWQLRIHGDIPKWPDVSAAFPIYVEPRKST